MEWEYADEAVDFVNCNDCQHDRQNETFDEKKHERLRSNKNQICVYFNGVILKW